MSKIKDILIESKDKQKEVDIVIKKKLEKQRENSYTSKPKLTYGSLNLLI